MLSGVFLLLAFGLARAEDGSKAWLRYAALPGSLGKHPGLPTSIVALNSSKASPVYSAGVEVEKALGGIFGSRPQVDSSPRTCPGASAIVVGTADAYIKLCGDSAKSLPKLDDDGFWLSVQGDKVHIIGQNERGALYGAFEYLSMLAQGNFSNVAYATNPDGRIRWVNQWDNLDGSIERGYAGPSIFFSNGLVVDDLTRVSDYGRLLASIRINGIIVNNVNANPNLLNSTNMQGLGRIADALRPWGVQVGISLNFASPQSFGGLTTFDPLDTGVIAFWHNITDRLYSHVPDFAGYLVKANSEGQPGPLTYNRTLAEGADLFAKALRPHGGILMFRAFVYDNKLSESNWKNDRANAAVEFFRHLDGDFDDNTLIQIKYGPIDFQVREPASPLFANLRQTSTAIELQVTQEYLGQQSHLVYLPPLWKEMLDFDMRMDGKPSPVRDIISGKRLGRKLGGCAAVVNVGTHPAWLGSHLAMANLYAYGRLAWDMRDDSQGMLEAWTRLTFGLDKAVVDAVTKMSMASWPAYENYSGNLGVQTLTDILYTHFGPNPASQDNNGWGQWTRADRAGIGMDRTVKNGTGNAGQYPKEVAAVFEDVTSTPDDLLLWFHHVPYTHRLRGSGKTVIQHFYDAHYAGAATAQTFPILWRTLEGRIDAQRFEETLFRLVFQAGHAIVWRDAVNGFYANLSGIADAEGRVGSHPWRIEAESMKLEGYQPYGVSPSEMASGARAIVTASNATAATATTRFPFSSGTYDVGVNYYDLLGGRSRYQLLLNGRPVGEWRGNLEDRLGHAFSTFLDGHSATRVTFPGVKVNRDDEVKIVGTPDGKEPAPLDYVVFLPAGVVD